MAKKKKSQEDQVVENVKRILCRHIGARNSDMELIYQFMMRFTSASTMGLRQKHLLRKILFQMPSLETITRFRRLLQKHGLYKSAAKTLADRRALEKAVRIALHPRASNRGGRGF